MKTVKLTAGMFFCLLTLPPAGAAGAEARFETARLEITRNLNSEVCTPVYQALFAAPAYVTPDPVQEKAARENAPYLFVGALGFTNLKWTRLTWADFKALDPARYTALMDTDAYDHTYAVYRGVPDVDFYGEGRPRPVYSLVHMSSELLPEIFVQDDGLALATGLKKLKASDLLVYGPHAYPVVRAPGRVSVYEVDTDAPGKQSFEQKTFEAVKICDYRLEAAP